MAVMKSHAVATLIGDVVDSRLSSDRDALHARLRKVVDAANGELEPTTPLRITVGDEFQGAFATVGAALHAAFWLRLELLPDADLRHGIGWGDVSVLETAPRVEDGPGWWAAREAIEHVKAASERAGMRRARCRYQRAAEDGPDPAAVNAALLCRDELLGAGDDRTVRLLRGMLAGRSQRELAAEEGITPSAVSQRARHDGIAVLLASDALLGEVA